MNIERYNRIQQVLKARQTDLTLCLEEVHKPNNVSAIVRTADAVGLHQIHAVWPNGQMRTLAHTSAGARNWVEVETHDTIEQAVTELKAQNMQVLITNLSDDAVDFRKSTIPNQRQSFLAVKKKVFHNAHWSWQIRISLFLWLVWCSR